jgi:hypothetical protein
MFEQELCPRCGGLKWGLSMRCDCGYWVWDEEKQTRVVAKENEQEADE